MKVLISNLALLRSKVIMKINTLLRSVLILLVILFYGGCDTKQIEFDISEQG